MRRDKVILFSGLTRRRGSGIILIWLAIGLLFSAAYLTARRVIVNEIRQHAMGVAIAVAAGIQAEDLEAIHTPADMVKPEYNRIREVLDRVSILNPDVQYIYTMRRDRAPGAMESDYVYVVDETTRDRDGDGTIGDAEVSQLPGVPYDASEWPHMIEAWYQPTADDAIQPDPPYPDLMSGYAPIRNERAQTVGIVGVDITADTVSQKLVAVQIVMGFTGAMVAILFTLVILLYYQQREAFDHIKLLSEELESRNEMLRASNKQLAKQNAQMENDLKLAQTVQLGFLPTTFPRQDRVVFDKFYLTSDILGGDLFDVFSLGQDHVAIYIADVAGHGVSAALISGLLKMAVQSVKEKNAFARGHLHADLLQPDRVLYSLNEMLVKEIPEYEFITLIYGVLDLSSNTLRLANAGHPHPLRYSPATSRLEELKVAPGPALGFLEDQHYPTGEFALAEGDRIVFYTDGLTEAMNANGEEFGEERCMEVIRQCGNQAPGAIIAALRRAVDAHRGSEEVSDDFSMLVAEIR